MTVKMADEIKFYACEHCSSLHIGLFREGKLFAEAIPNDTEEVFSELTLAVMEIRARSIAPGQKH